MYLNEIYKILFVTDAGKKWKRNWYNVKDVHVSWAPKYDLLPCGI